MKKIAVLLFLLLVSTSVSATALVDCDKERTDERITLACNIYFEARSELPDGQWAIAFVTRNRVNSKLFPNTYSKVVWDIRINTKTRRKVAHFSWALDGKSDKVYDKDAWKRAWWIAGIILDKTIMVIDSTEGALWYHADYIRPKWHKMYERTTSIGTHIFYK